MIVPVKLLGPTDLIYSMTARPVHMHPTSSASCACDSRLELKSPSFGDEPVGGGPRCINRNGESPIQY
jgi:hypothetical protein